MGENSHGAMNKKTPPSPESTESSERRNVKSFFPIPIYKPYQRWDLTMHPSSSLVMLLDKTTMDSVLNLIRQTWQGLWRPCKRSGLKQSTRRMQILKMHVKLSRTAKALKLWRRQNLGNLPLRLALMNERITSPPRANARNHTTNTRRIGISWVSKGEINWSSDYTTRARQHSRLTWIRKGDACTKFFMLYACNRKKRLFIPSLTNSAGNTVTNLQ